MVAKKAGASGAELKFAEIKHDRVTEKGYETGWVQMTANKGEVLCATEAAVQQLLQSVPLLEKLSSSDRMAIANVLEASSYVEDHQSSMPQMCHHRKIWENQLLWSQWFLVRKVWQCW